jgi:tetratricopeptide (TPR) repeat protein
LPKRAVSGYFVNMKFLAAATFFLFAVALPPALAQEAPDDQYVIIYSLIQQADTTGSSGEPQQALEQYLEVQGELQKFQKIYPDWNPKIVSFRLNYLAAKIDAVTAQLPATNPPPQIVPATNATPAVSTNDFNAELDALRAQVQSLQADNMTLDAKLKEALAEQPAVIDSRELTRAQEQIRSLMKENDLLKASVAQGATGTVVGTNGTEPDALKSAQQALAEVNQKLAEQLERANRLAAENQSLQARLQSLMTGPDAAEALREENALLKKQLAGLRAAAATNSTDTAKLNSDLAAAHAQIATLQSQVEVGALEKMALQDRVKQLQAGNSAPVTASPDQKENELRIRELTQERDDLLAKLGAANRELYGRKKQNVAAQISELTGEVNTLRARLAVDEATAVPYTTEELALFQNSAPQPANPDAEKKSISELPEGSASLVAEAQTYFTAKQYDKAEDDYLKILRRDENNGLVLANLAAIEMEQGKLDDAEKHIKAAVAQSPDDAYNLSTLGHLEFMRAKYDDALEALGRAAKLDPQNPEIQNYLGLTLAHKGLRAQAETAFRMAIQMDPNYGDAHNNLAVIYISQQPPLVELARWHYQKALDAGQPRNPDLEKMIAAGGAPVNP